MHALSPIWGLPFAGMLLSIALAPLLAPRWWHHHYGKVAAAWALAFLLPCAIAFGPGVAAGQFMHALRDEYVPFVVLLGTLYTVAGGIHVRGNLHGSPGLNTGLLALGAALASFMGTTGACMLLIRPLLRANDNRRHVAHVVVFFIFIVGNAGGALTPLGDPPLFLGFLQGVGFFWTAQHLWAPALFIVGTLLALFYALDAWLFHRHGEIRPQDPTPDTHGTHGIAIEGRINLLLLAAVVALVLASGLGLPGWARDLGLAALALASLKLTPKAAHEANQFHWEPMLEVAKLFAGIFLTIVPVIAMLQVGADGPFGAVVRAVTRPDGAPDPAMYFWATGLLSSFLDNAPTYLVFFNTAGGDAATLMTALAPTLAAISAGAVFMGANTYIGNAPNLMVKAIAESRGVRMPGFFGYMLWSGGILLPLFVAMSFIWF
jgi:Na+/H+ antiporter NhaD/arsenite permease-like protein